MSDPLIIQMLEQKRAEISGAIAAYQAQIAQARHDLACGFRDSSATDSDMGSATDSDLSSATRELAERVMCERNLDPTDGPLRNSVVFKVVQALRHAARRNLVIMVEKRKGICVWETAQKLTPRDANTLSKRG